VGVGYGRKRSSFAEKGTARTRTTTSARASNSFSALGKCFDQSATGIRSRNRALEANGAENKLAILERGLVKSINNLNGSKPLNM
jgi:hypothetical protein